MKIPRYAPRLDCMIFKGGFERDVRDLTETLDIVSNSCTQVLYRYRNTKYLDACERVGGCVALGESSPHVPPPPLLFLKSASDL